APATFTATVTGNDAAALTGQPLPADLMAEALRKADFANFPKLGTTTGSVQFKDGGQPIGSPVPLVNGVATFTTSSLGGGSHQITPPSLGAGAYSASAPAAVTQVVGVQSTPVGVVPATLALTLGSSAPSFGVFTAGVDKTYTTSTAASIISTAGDASLTVSDP